MKEEFKDIKKGAIAKAEAMDEHVHKTLTEEEFNLGDLSIESVLGKSLGAQIFRGEDVKDFIRRLKGKIPQFLESHLQIEPHHKLILFGKFCKEIDKLAGEKLI